MEIDLEVVEDSQVGVDIAYHAVEGPVTSRNMDCEELGVENGPRESMPRTPSTIEWDDPVLTNILVSNGADTVWVGEGLSVDIRDIQGMLRSTSCVH